MVQSSGNKDTQYGIPRDAGLPDGDTELMVIDRTPPPVHLRIGAERRASGSGGVYQHVNPATGQPDAEIPLAGAAEVDEAARTAHAVFAGWRATRPAQRRRLLNRLRRPLGGEAAPVGRRAPRA